MCKMYYLKIILIFFKKIMINEIILIYCERIHKFITSYKEKRIETPMILL